MALKLNRNLDNNIPTKNIIKSEKAYPVCFAVFSRLLSASNYLSAAGPRASLYYVNGRLETTSRI